MQKPIKKNYCYETSIKNSYLKHHSFVINFRPRKHIKAEWATLVSLSSIIPIECAYTNLKSNKLITDEFHFLISFFNCIIIMTFIILYCTMTYETMFINQIYVPENSVSIAMKSAFFILSSIIGRAEKKFS